LKLPVIIITLNLVLYVPNVRVQITVDALSPVQISVTASKVAGIGLVIEAVTGEPVLLTASKVAGTGFVIEAVTGETVYRSVYTPFTLLRILVALPRGLPGG